MRFHLPTREAPPSRRPPLPHAPPDAPRYWFRWAIVVALVFALGVTIAVATIPERHVPGPLERTTLTEQSVVFRQFEDAARPGELQWLTGDQQRARFRAAESVDVLNGVGLDRQWSMFRTADAAQWPVLEGMDLAAQRTMFREREATG